MSDPKRYYDLNMTLDSEYPLETGDLNVLVHMALGWANSVRKGVSVSGAPVETDADGIPRYVTGWRYYAMRLALWLEDVALH